MQSIRFIVGRPRGASREVIQAVLFSTREWAERDARVWLDRNGFKARNLDKDLGWWRADQRERSEFEARTLRPIDTGRREKVTMASNPKRRGRKRRAKAPAKVKRRSRRRPARSKAKTTRTTVKTVKVMRTNPKRRRRRARRPRPGTTGSRKAVRRAVAAARFTVAMAPSSARAFAQVARLSKQRRREMRRALRRHPRGGVYVALPAWHGTRDQAQRLAERMRLLLVYAAGRRRASLTSASVPRVVAVP